MDFIKLENICKKYDNLEVLKDVSINIPQGSIYGLLGPNGAGKTTTIRIVNGIVGPNSGNVYLEGNKLDLKEKLLNKKAGVLTETASCYELLTAVENLKFFASLYGADSKNIESRIDYLLKKLSLYDAKDRKVKTYSTGMKKRINLARALIHDPEILFLDEPTTGLDPETSEIVNNFIKEMVEQNHKTVVLCTHQLKYAQDICTHYGFINHGKIVAEGSYEQLLQKYDNSIYLSLKLSVIPQWLEIYEQKNEMVVVKAKDEKEVASIIKKLNDESIKIYMINTNYKDLTELYFSIIDGGEGHE